METICSSTEMAFVAKGHIKTVQGDSKMVAGEPRVSSLRIVWGCLTKQVMERVFLCICIYIQIVDFELILVICIYMYICINTHKYALSATSYTYI